MCYSSVHRRVLVHLKSKQQQQFVREVKDCDFFVSARVDACVYTYRNKQNDERIYKDIKMLRRKSRATKCTRHERRDEAEVILVVFRGGTRQSRKRRQNWRRSRNAGSAREFDIAPGKYMLPHI